MTRTSTPYATETRRHVLLAIRQGQPEIVQVFGTVDSRDAWAQAVDAHARLQADADAEGVKARDLHYAVRDSDHELVVHAAAAVADQLTPKQLHVLDALAQITAPGESIQPGSRKVGAIDRQRWASASSMYSGDVPAIAAKLQARGLVSIAGLDYAPKTYRVSPVGRLVADAI